MVLSRVESRLERCPFSPAGWRPRAFDYDYRLQRLESFVREHFCDPISLARAAHEACLTRCYFSTYFRRHVGIGFHRWLTCLRIQRAARELIVSDVSVTDIAWAVGFQDMTTFARAFRRITGTTPTWFRRRYRAEPAAPGRPTLLSEHSDASSRGAQVELGTAAVEGAGDLVAGVAAALSQHLEVGAYAATGGFRV